MKSPKYAILLAIVGVLILVGLTVGVLLTFFGNSQKQSSTHSNDSGTALDGDVRRLVGDVSSTRNLSGLTLRINQVDVCKLPDLTAYVAVSSDSGEVSKLSSKDVTVMVDGKTVSSPQFDPVDTVDRPLSATLLIDRSGSMAGAPIEQAKNATKTFIAQSGAKDQIAAVSFSTDSNVLSDLTTNHGAVSSAIDDIQAEGNTALYDALAKANEVTSSCTRRAIILLSDGGDTASKSASLQSVLDTTNKAGIPIFAVGLKGSTYDGSVLQQLSEKTGGQRFEADDPGQLSSLYQRVNDLLKGQYYIGLKLSIPKTGGQHTLTVTSRVGGSDTTSTRHFIY